MAVPGGAIAFDQDLGYGKHDPAGKNTGNSRNGKSKKTIITDQGTVPIEVPRDRNEEYEPQIVKKLQRRFECYVLLILIQN
jgi:putative transposase